MQPQTNSRSPKQTLKPTVHAWACAESPSRWNRTTSRLRLDGFEVRPQHQLGSSWHLAESKQAPPPRYKDAFIGTCNFTVIGIDPGQPLSEMLRHSQGCRLTSVKQVRALWSHRADLKVTPCKLVLTVHTLQDMLTPTVWELYTVLMVNTL